MGIYRYEILRETTTDSLIMENNTREKKMNSNVYGIDLGTCNMKIYCKTSNKILNEKNTIALVKKTRFMLMVMLLMQCMKKHRRRSMSHSR